MNFFFLLCNSFFLIHLIFIPFIRFCFRQCSGICFQGTFRILNYLIYILIINLNNYSEKNDCYCYLRSLKSYYFFFFHSYIENVGMLEFHHHHTNYHQFKINCTDPVERIKKAKKIPTIRCCFDSFF